MTVKEGVKTGSKAVLGIGGVIGTVLTTLIAAQPSSSAMENRQNAVESRLYMIEDRLEKKLDRLEDKIDRLMRRR